MDQVSRESGDRFDTATWEVLMKIMLSITDYLLKDPNDDPNQLGSKLCPLLLKVLFQIWLRSQSFNDELWKALEKLIYNWRHRMPTIPQWNSVCLGITNRVIRLLYGPNEGTEELIISEYDDSKTTYTMGKEFIYYSWYRMLHLLGDLESIQLPNNYLEAMRGVSTITDCFLAIGTKPSSSPTLAAKPPDGNTILHVVGPFLFESVNSSDQIQSLDRGRAIAFIALSRIFSVKNRSTEFDPLYLSCFYRAMEHGLKRNNYMMAVILNNSLTLFQCEFKGIRMLVPSFFAAIQQVLMPSKALEGISSKIQVLRTSCIRILSSFICLPHYFGSLLFRENESPLSSEPSQLISYNELRTRLNEVFLEGLRTEEDATNRQNLLWIITAYLYENIDFVELENFPHLVITLLLSKLTTNSWSLEDSLQALKILSELGNLYASINKWNQETAPYLVFSLAKFVESCMQEKKGQELPEALITRCFYCMTEWIMNDTKNQWLLSKTETLKCFLEVIEIGITGQRFIPEPKATETPRRKTNVREPEKKPDTPVVKKDAPKGYHPPTEKIREASYFALMNILYHLDNFPTCLGASNISALWNEKEILDAYRLSSNYIKNFIYGNHTLISVIRLPRENGKKTEAIVIMRNEAGRFAWKAGLDYYLTPFVEPACEDKLRSEDAKSKMPLEPEVDEGLLTTLQTFLSEPEKKLQQKMLSFCDRMVSSENNILKGKNYGLSVDISIKRPNPVALDDSLDPTAGRLLLTHLGLLSLSNFDEFLMLQRFNEPDRKFNYLQNYSILDKSRERENLQIGIIYIKKGQQEWEVFENQGGSVEYLTFLQNIGWLINLNNHLGFAGSLDLKTTGSITPYFATYDIEVIFQVATLMPNKDPSTKQVHKTRLINNNKVLISWTEDLDNYRAPTDSAYSCNLVISPLQSGLFHVKVILRGDETSSLPFVGPIVDNMVLSPYVLPTLVRQTALNAARFTKDDRAKPITVRRLMLDDFSQRYKVEQIVSSHFASQFIC